jgi:hypothetical protein
MLEADHSEGVIARRHRRRHPAGGSMVSLSVAGRVIKAAADN